MWQPKVDDPGLVNKNKFQLKDEDEEVISKPPDIITKSIPNSGAKT